MAPVLKLDDHDKDREIEFELDYLRRLSTKERFEMMFRKREELLMLLEKSGYRRTPQVIKRT